MVQIMRVLRLAGALLALLAGGEAMAADTPSFQVDPFWPKPLPNNWLLGEVAGVAVDAQDHVWIIQRRAR